MASNIRVLPSQLRLYVSRITVFSAIGAIGWWGHLTHWKLAPAHGGTHEQAHEVPTTGPDPDHVVLSIESDETPESAGIHVELPRTERIESIITANGVVDFNRNKIAELSVKASGAIWRVEKHLGQRVEKGDILALIDAREVGDAKATLLSAVAERQYRRTVLERLKANDAVIAAKLIREAEADLRRAEVLLYNAQQSLVNLGLPISLDRINEMTDVDLQQEIHFLGLPEELTAQLDRATVSANLIPIRAPFSGVVGGRDAVVGEIVTPSTPVFTLVDLESMWIFMDVRMEDADKVIVGQNVVFTPDGQSSEIEGTISWIAAEIDSKTRTLKVRVDVRNPETNNGAGHVETRILRAHSFGTGRIQVSARDNAVVISKRCIQWDGNQPSVFVQSGPAEFERRSISTGIESGEDIEIIAGLNASDGIAEVGSRLLYSEFYKRRSEAQQ